MAGTQWPHPPGTRATVRPPVLFFGVLTGDGAGHFLHAPGGKIVVIDSDLPMALRRLDGVWTRETPRSNDEMRYGAWGAQVEGEAFIHYVEGWTVLAWWDRSEDRRGVSNAAFLAPGRHPFVSMMDLAREHFPREMARMEAAYRIALATGDLPPDDTEDAAHAFIVTFYALHRDVRSAVLRLLQGTS